jgi:hypothetical protein|uniref:Uncharacterized protein n=1 Tax=Siphoviridae sp. ctoiW10 TaxID=2827592 RepID=A0A8S5LP92_9CAUD|nr:MAG TPA: hypothetical protein [Siphoviridae sp. ctoiW10]
MITFTDKRLYAKGICSAQLQDPSTGEILSQSDKFSTGNIQFSANTDPLRAGLGNGIATIIASDSDTQVSFTRADFDLMSKMMAVGGAVNYNAVSPVCQTVEATGTSLKADVSKLVPVAQYGYSNIFCYVQEVGAASSYSVGGVPYPIDPATGAITGFTAESGKSYKVWYFAKKPAAQVGIVNGAFNGRIVHFTAQIAVYQNVSGTKGTRWGWAYLIVPRLYLNPEGANTTGDQSNYDTTTITGRAINEDAEVISAECDACGGMGTVAYMVLVPDEESDEVAGIAVIGGVVSVAASGTAPVGAKLVMKNGELVTPSPASLLKYTVTAGTATGTTVSTDGIVTAGSTQGTGSITIQYPAEGAAKYTAQAVLEVTGE